MNSGSKAFRGMRTAAFGAAVSLAFAVSGPATGQASLPETAPPPPAGSVGGVGDVNLFPKRVVIDGRRSIATVGLYNKAVNPGDYEITIVDMGMTPEGQLLAFDNGLDPASQARVKTASQMLRYSPRRVTLRGTESQIIRIMARAGAELPDGEYRSHFTVTSVPEADGFSIEQATTGSSDDGIGVTIRPRFGIAIPIIVRIGETTLDVGISNARVLTARDGTQAVAFTLNRSGTRSAFGDITVKAAGSSDPIAISKGVGVYPEVDSRQVIVPIDPESDRRLTAPGAKLRIEFVDDDFSPGSKLAELDFVVP